MSTDLDVAIIEDPRKARAILTPLRQQILAAAHEPSSSTTIAATLGLPRQRVNYHVRQLAAAGLLKRAGRRQRRGLVEQRWVASARSIVIAPRLDDALTVDIHALQPAAGGTTATAHGRDGRTDLGATYLLALASTVQREVAVGTRVERRRGKSLPTFALDAELKFESAAQRARFAAAIQDAIRAAIAEHTTASAGGPTYRMAFGVYPIPSETTR